MEGLSVSCDGCQKVFRIAISVRIIRPGVECHGFKCPGCGNWYPSFYRTKAIRRKLADAYKLKIKGLKTVDPVKRDALLTKAAVLQEKAVQDMDQLKEEFAKAEIEGGN